jgi:hypothetical protein
VAIGSAIERGSFIFAYDEHGRTLFSKARGSGPKERACSSTADCDLIANHEGDFAAQDVGDLIAVMDGLLGFTGSTVTVRFGSIMMDV